MFIAFAVLHWNKTDTKTHPIISTDVLFQECNEQTNQRKERKFTGCSVNWFSMRIVCDCKSFLKSTVVISKHLGQKPYLFAAHIPEIGYKRKCPSSPQRKRYPTLAAWRVQKSRDSESNTFEKCEMLRQKSFLNMRTFDNNTKILGFQTV